MAGYIGNIPVPQGTQTRQSFTAIASQTSFPTIGYTAGFIDVYLNGVKLIDGTDFTASNGSDVVLAVGASASDVLNVVIFDTFTSSNGTFNDATLKNNVTLKNDTHEDSDGGRASKIIYQGEQSGGEISTLAEIQASHDGTSDDQKGDLIFKTNDGSDNAAPTEAMRIDSNGNLLVGTTDTTVYDNNSNTTADNGLNLRGDGKLDAARYNGIVLGLNLTGNDGTIVDLRKDGTTVGTIENSGTALVFENPNANSYFAFHANNQSNGIFYQDGTSKVFGPYVARDDEIDLGASNARWKDLYLSGGAYIGGTGSANYLEDYEEGTFTPVLSGSNPSGGNPTYNVQLGLYTKIGNMVEVNLCVSCVASSLEVQANDLVITGLPFTNLPSSSPTGQNFPTLTVWPQSGINNTATTQGYGALIGNSSTNITIYGHVSSTGSNYVNVKYNELSTSSSNNSFQIRITGTYRTNA
jgi:hypothetical protein